MTARYAVFGHPVAHSLSPRIHAAFARQTGVEMEYAAIDAAPNEFDSALAAFASVGGRGANITLPHKEHALALCSGLRSTRRALPSGVSGLPMRSWNCFTIGPQ